jgi:hypothetical protein
LDLFNCRVNRHPRVRIAAVRHNARLNAPRSSNSNAVIFEDARTFNGAASSNFEVGNKVSSGVALHGLDLRLADGGINVRLSGLCRQAQVK